MFEELCNRDPKSISNLALAYVGDCIFELYVRLYLVEKINSQMKEIHKTAIIAVSAKGQASAFRKIMDQLTDEELLIFKRGRNTHTPSMAKNANPADYQTATGSEALIGYLYLSKEYERLKFIIDSMISYSFNEQEIENG